MDNNLNDQTTENSEGEEKSTSSYTDPNAGYTEAEPQAKNDNSVPKEAADDNLKQEEKSHPAYTYGEMPKSENGSGYGQSAPGGSACHSGTSDGTYENNTYNGNSYYNGTDQSGAYTNGYSDKQYQNGGYNTGFNANGYNMELLPAVDHGAVDAGLKYVNNDICYPSILVTGQIMEAVTSGRYDTDKFAVIIT